MPTSKSSRRAALTLVELLVAIVLSAMLIGVITFVWLQSNRIFMTTMNNVEAYQRLRTVLDMFERDLSNMNRTVEMDYFTDTNANGRYDEGVDGPALIAGANYRAPRDPADPLVRAGLPEFCEEGNGGFSARPFFFAPTILSPPPYTVEGEGYLEGRAYWRDEIFAQCGVSQQGASRPALVHYRLVPWGTRSALRRRIWLADANGQPTAEGDQTAILAHDLLDLKFGFYFQPATAATGITGATFGPWYHVGLDMDGGGSSAPAQDLFATDRDRGLASARDATQGISTQHLNQFGGDNAISFVYEGFARIEENDGIVQMRTINAVNAPPPVGPRRTTAPEVFGPANLNAYTNFDFPGVRPGDRVYVFDATDDDATLPPEKAGSAEVPFHSPPRGPGQAAGNEQNVFPAQYLTVDEIYSVNQFWVSMTFNEQINMATLRKYWLAYEPAVEVLEADLSGPTDPGGPARRITSSFNVRYRVGFLPPAILARVSIDDRYNQQVRVLERVIKVLQH